MNETVNSILSSATAGAAGGLVVWAFSRWWKRLWDWRKRKSQIVHIASVIVRHRTKIYEVTEAPPFRTSFTNDFDRRQFQRNVLYDAFREELERLLERRASNLSFEQKDEIENLLIRRFRKEVGNRRLKGLRLGAPDPEWYVETFEKIASMEWLKLPPARDDHAILGDIEHLRR